MKRVIFLTLLAMGLPTASLANVIVAPSCPVGAIVCYDTGTFQSGTLSGSFTTAVDVSVTGNLANITTDTGTLTLTPVCPVGSICYVFSGGSVSVMSGGSTVFTDSLTGGLVVTTGNSVVITASLAPEGIIAYGNTSTSVVYNPTNGMLLGGAAGLTGFAPEPGTLGLLGTGVLGLAAMIRRKIIT